MVKVDIIVRLVLNLAYRYSGICTEFQRKCDLTGKGSLWLHPCFSAQKNLKSLYGQVVT